MDADRSLQLARDAAKQAAMAQFTPKDLVSHRMDYQDEHRSQLPYKLVGDRMVPNEKIPQAPPKPVFMTYANSGRNVISRVMLEHFKGPCSSCALRGHSASHPGCFFSGKTPTWTICETCNTGFHSPKDCRLDLSCVVPYTQR